LAKDYADPSRGGASADETLCCTPQDGSTAVASKPKYSVLAPGDCGIRRKAADLLKEIDLMSESFTAFREQYLSRHEKPVNSALHTLADALEVAGLAAGVVTRRISSVSLSRA